jgi:hypothetical protein
MSQHIKLTWSVQQNGSEFFKKFQDIMDYNHNTMHLKWKVTSLDFNTFDVEYLCFDSTSFIF